MAAPDDVVDLDTTPKPAPPGEPAAPEPRTVALQMVRAKSRRYLAYLVVGILAVLVVLPIVVYAWVLPSAQQTFTNLEAMLTLMFAPIIGLVGTILGFYFGGREVEEAPPSEAQAE